jgi:16S rRNA G966 N2-methylase RsmD
LSRESIRLTRQNLAHCGAEEKAVVFQSDYRRALGRIREQVDVFLLDPPYYEGIYEGCLNEIMALDLLKDDGIIVAEHDSRNGLPEETGVAMAYGLSEEMAFKALTINAAKVIKLDHRIGSLEVGKDADLAIFDGHPLSNMTRCKATMIDGKFWYNELNN